MIAQPLAAGAELSFSETAARRYRPPARSGRSPSAIQSRGALIAASGSRCLATIGRPYRVPSAEGVVSDEQWAHLGALVNDFRKSNTKKGIAMATAKKAAAKRAPAKKAAPAKKSAAKKAPAKKARGGIGGFATALAHR